LVIAYLQSLHKKAHQRDVDTRSDGAYQSTAITTCPLKDTLPRTPKPMPQVSPVNIWRTV